MDFKEIRSLERHFGKHLNYKGLNLWKFIDVALYYKFLSEENSPNIAERLMAKLTPILFKIQQTKRSRFKTPPNKSKSEVLFLPFAKTHLGTFKPVLEKLDSYKVVIKDSLANYNTRDYIEELGIPYSWIEFYADRTFNDEIKKIKKWVKSAWNDISNDKKIRELFDKKSYLEGALKYFLVDRKRLVEIISYIELIERMYSKEKPKLVVVADEHTDFGNIAITLAKKRGIKTLNIQHGSIINNEIVKSELKPDLTAVFSPKDKQFLVDQGLDAKKIKVTGKPEYDALLDKNLDRSKECKRFGLNPNKKICLFATQYGINKQDEIAIKKIKNFVFETFQKRDDLQLIIKTHPSDKQDYSPYISDRVKVVNNSEFNKILLNLSDVIMTVSSTIALEGVICDKPLIIVNRGQDIYYVDEGVALKATNGNELSESLDFVFKDRKTARDLKKNRTIFKYNYAYKLDGKTVERVLGLIKKLVKND